MLHQTEKKVFALCSCSFGVTCDLDEARFAAALVAHLNAAAAAAPAGADRFEEWKAEASRADPRLAYREQMAKTR